VVVKNVAIGETTYDVTAVERDGRWIAEARKAPSGMRIGPPSSAATADEAVARLVRWLEWQREHEDALMALQAAEQAYHRAIAGSVFASGLAEATEVQHEGLQRIEEARLRLEDIRQSQPEV
jgi:hypothetical protein